MKDFKIIKIIALVAAIALIISSIFIIRSCSAPPDYEEIRARVEELIEASYDINEVIWGAGLPTYERVIDPKSSLILYETGKTYLDKNGEEQPLNYHYYYTLCKDRTVIGFRQQKAYTSPYSYAYVTDTACDASSLAAIFPLAEGASADDSLYTEVYSSAETGKFAYLVPYIEPAYDFYYSAADPSDYDYVLADSPYSSVDAIKDYVRSVYAESYADSLDSILFDGVMEGDFIQKARYSLYTNSRGVSMLASLNTYKPLFTERRVYLFDTARIDRNNSNDKSVQVEISSYLPSSPDKLVTAKIVFSLQNGQWFLASPTY